MSRHAVPARDPSLQAVVGWDPPLMTFFGQVSRIGHEDDDEEGPVLWVGTSWRELCTLRDLECAMQPHVDLGPAIYATLQDDQNWNR